ncbi:MAG: mechanosensitive ion channel family protein [Burkholderiaceae bacterium]|nr:mechanosensitive ion channel family protein [Burkholderiaceae bacterium]
MKDIVERFFVAHMGAELPAWAKGLVALTNVFLILLISWALMSASGRVIRTLNQRVASKNSDLEERKRIETLMRVFRYVASVVIGALTVMLVLAEIGISIAPILATAGVAGLAVGFGAQSLVKDYFTGFVMLLEDQIRVGDAVEVGGKTGTVEEVTLRYIRLRDHEGAVHFVPNGVIATVTNKSREYAYAVMDVRVSYRADLDRVIEVIRDAGNEFSRGHDVAEDILQPLEILGIEQWNESHQILRCRFKVRPAAQGDIRRGFLKLLKQRFDVQGIALPFKET